MVTKQTRVIGTKIGLANTYFCNFRETIQGDTEHSFLIYRLLK